MDHEPMDPPQTRGLRARIETTKEQMVRTWGKYERYAPATFFLLGFLFDALTLERIDSGFQILQQGLFLFLIFVVLTLLILHETKPFSVPKWLELPWTYRVEALHFLIGGLLSAFTLFFIKSTSFIGSFIFLSFMLFVLVANEFERIQAMGLAFKYALFALCTVCFLSYVIPIVTGFIGFGPLLIVVGLTAFLITGIGWLYLKWGVDYDFTVKKVIQPGLGVLVVFVGLYWFRLIPPVPLSVQHMGIYHLVEKTPENQYAIYHERPWWKFWVTGDANFKAQPGDKLYCFVRVFSPTNFSDQVRLHWLKHHPDRGWETMDKIPFTVRGGRAEGFRGFGYKTNYDPGDWRVQLETSGGREIGRVYFNVESVEADATREFEVQVF